MDADNTLEQLKQGNYRFVDNQSLAFGRDVSRARELAGADSRVAPAVEARRSGLRIETAFYSFDAGEIDFLGND
jgi:hypothetical protein